MTPAIRRIIVSQGINYISNLRLLAYEHEHIGSEFWYVVRLWTRQRIDEESVSLTSMIIPKF